MTDYYVSYGVVALLGAMAFLFAGGTFLIWRLLRPSHPTRQKVLTYECGVDAIGETWVQPNVRYYIFAFLFVIFDVEALFLLPWAVVYEDIGLFAVLQMTVFLTILMVGLVYAWGHRILDWV